MLLHGIHSLDESQEYKEMRGSGFEKATSCFFFFFRKGKILKPNYLTTEVNFD